MVFDLLEVLSKRVNFTYSVEIEKKTWGSRDETTGDWTGMIGLLTENKSDMAVQIFDDLMERREVSWKTTTLFFFLLGHSL